MEQLLLTIPECCRLASIGRTKFYELIATGEIPIRKIGRKTREGRPPCQGSLLGLASCRWPRLDRGKPFDPIPQVRSRDQRLPTNLADRNFASSDQLVKFRAPNCCQTAAFGNCEQQILHRVSPRGRFPLRARW